MCLLLWYYIGVRKSKAKVPRNDRAHGWGRAAEATAANGAGEAGSNQSPRMIERAEGMSIYVFIPQEIIEDGDDIVAEAHEVDGVNGGKLHKELHELATEAASYYMEPMTCYRLERVSDSLTNVLSGEEQAAAYFEMMMDCRRDR